MTWCYGGSYLITQGTLNTHCYCSRNNVISDGGHASGPLRFPGYQFFPILPLPLRLKLATDKMLHSIEVDPNWPVYGISLTILCHSNRPYYPTTSFRSTSLHMVTAKSFPDRSRPLSCKSTQMGPCQIRYLWMRPTADNEPHSPKEFINKFWRWSAITPQGGRQMQLSWPQHSKWNE